MTHRANPVTGVAIGLFAMLSISACDARTERGASGSAATPRPPAASAGATTDMAGMDHSTMPGMDHSSMPGMAPAPRTTTPGGTVDHSAMAGMDHSATPGMDHSSTPGMARAARTTTPARAMDHSAMAGMDHSRMPATGATPRPTAGAMDHSTMHGMDHSGAAGTAAPRPTGAALAASSPANGAMLQGSPSAISLTLPRPMTLQSVSLSNAVGQRIPLSAALPDGPVETFTSPIPPLPAGSYTVAWTAGTGARTVSGAFTFMVH